MQKSRRRRAFSREEGGAWILRVEPAIPFVDIGSLHFAGEFLGLVDDVVQGVTVV
jgi:hypothetical protein